jgi:hypothetical protein
MKIQKLSEIIDKNWFQDLSDGRERVWTFEDDLMSSSDKVLTELADLYADFKGIENKCFSSKELLNGSKVDKSYLFKFLHCITLSEYRFDSLLYSRETRDKEIANYAIDIGLPLQEVIKIYQWWHSGARNKVYN